MRHAVSALVENRAGVLTRVSGLFSRRGYNIESLAVGITEDPKISRMSIVVIGDDPVVNQVVKQLDKLAEVICVRHLTPGSFLEREMVFIKVAANHEKRSHIVQIAEIFRARIIDVSHTTITLELTGTDEKIYAFCEMLEPFGVCEIVRTGSIAIERGEGSFIYLGGQDNG